MLVAIIIFFFQFVCCINNNNNDVTNNYKDISLLFSPILVWCLRCVGRPWHPPRVVPDHRAPWAGSVSQQVALLQEPLKTNAAPKHYRDIFRATNPQHGKTTQSTFRLSTPFPHRLDLWLTVAQQNQQEHTNQIYRGVRVLTYTPIRKDKDRGCIRVIHNYTGWTKIR